jgi:hypothetical protein
MKSPFERVRVLDPVPVERFNQNGLLNVIKAFPAFAGARIHAELVGPDRRHARRGAGDRPGRLDAGLLHRQRLFRPRLRHRAGRGPADGRSRDRRAAVVSIPQPRSGFERFKICTPVSRCRNQHSRG